RAPIGDQLDRLKQSSPADFTDVRVVGKCLIELGPEPPALASAACDQLSTFEHTLHGKRGCARDRMADVRVAVLEKAAAATDRVNDARADQHCADRLVSAAEPLG